MDILLKANTLFEENKPEEAINILKKHIPKATNEDKAAITDLYIQWGFLEEAIPVLIDLIKENPDDHEFKVVLADLYIENDKDNEAILLLNEIPSDNEVYVQALLQLADLYQAQDLFEVAEDKLLEAKQILPDENIIDFALGELFFSIGDYKRATLYYELINEELMVDISIEERLAESYAASGEYEKALKYFSQLDSENPDILFKYGFTASQINRNDIAINTWNKVIEKDPLYHSAYLELAKVYRDEELIEKAYDTVLKGLKVDEHNKELYFLAGTLAHQLKDDENSDKWINKAIILDNDYKDAILFKISLLKDNEDFQAIITLINEIQGGGASDPFYDWELAKANNELEMYDEALRFYQVAYNNLKEDSDFLKEYGYFLIEEGKNNEGISVLNDYSYYEPEDFEIRELIERLTGN